MSESIRIDRDISWAVALVLAGAFFLVASGGIKNSLATGDGDPGPRAIPIAISWLLILGGAYTGVSTAIARRTGSTSSTPVDVLPSTYRTCVFALLAFAYVACVGFAFYVSTFAFGTLAIRWLGARWWTAALVSLAILFLVWGMFAKLFLVPLPNILQLISG